MTPLAPDLDFEAGYVLPVDKPLRWTSTDVVRKVKSLLRGLGYRRIKVGHAGTLDPLASGLLLVCIGRATKRVEELQAGIKEYEAGVMIGATTPSFDLEHPVDRTYPWRHITRAMFDEALAGLCGERFQTPPVYSAKMIDGRRAYDYAREGSGVELRRALIRIYGINVMDFALPEVKLHITCSRGTYIRSLAAELGEALDSGAHLTSLRRTRSGDHRVEEALTIERIEKILRPVKQNG